MYFGAEHLIGFLMFVPSAQWYSYLGWDDNNKAWLNTSESCISRLRRLFFLLHPHSPTPSCAPCFTAFFPPPQEQHHRCCRETPSSGSGTDRKARVTLGVRTRCRAPQPSVCLASLPLKRSHGLCVTANSTTLALSTVTERTFSQQILQGITSVLLAMV